MRTHLVTADGAALVEVKSALASRAHEILQHDGSNPRVATNGDARAELVLVDLALPDAEGFCRALAAAARGRTPYTLVVGEPPSAEALERLLHAGADGYLNARGPALDLQLAVAEHTARDRALLAELTSELRESEDRYRSVIAAMEEGVIVLDREQRVLTVNRSAERILGVSADEIVQRMPNHPMREFIRENGAVFPVSEHPASVSLRTGRPVTNVVMGLRDTSGDTTWISVNSQPIWWETEEEAPHAVVVSFTNLTNIRRSEAQLRTADRLASVGRIAAAVGHEINNPLTYVLGNLGALAALLESPRSAARDTEAQRLVVEAAEGAERVRRIVRDLKVFSQRDEDERVAVDVRRVLESCVNIAWNEIRHRAKLLRDYAAETPAVFANEARLGQVFLNLLVNAAQAIPEGNAQAHHVRVSTRASASGQVVVTIEDTGVGIPRENLARAFEPFFTTKPGGQGTGLGLSICHNLVSAMGGTISVESVVGKGSTFRVSLPATEAQIKRTSQPPSPRSSPGAESRRVLIVDDEPRVASMLKQLLSEHDVVVASSGREAIALLDAPPDFDAVLCDLMMSDLTGMDVYEHVARARPGLERRIVFMTGGAFTPRATEFLARAPNACLEKPFQMADLLGALRRVMRAD